MKLNNNFVFLSDLLEFHLIELNNNKKLGKILDFVANQQQTFPKITGILVKKKYNQKVFIPWSNVNKISLIDKNIILNDKEITTGIPSNLSENEILLKETFLDNQIVDISGSKVVRVNDLQLIKENANLWLVHIDVGLKGLYRRLGWLKFFNFISNWLLGRELKEKFISWKYAQPINTINIHGAISLKIPSSRLSEIHPADLADIIEELGYDDRMLLFQSLDNSIAAKTLQEIPVNIQLQIVEMLDPNHFVNLLNEMEIDEIVDLFAKLPQEKINEFFKLLPDEMILEIKELLTHSRFSAGSLVNTEFISENEDTQVIKMLDLIKTEYNKVESIYYIYVTDDNESLVGVVTLRDLLISEPDKKLLDIMRENIVKVEIHENIKSVAHVFFKYDFHSVPVVDESNKIKGIITIKDAFEAIFPEITQEKIR